MSVLRHEVFYSLSQLNQRIKELLLRMNNKPFQKISGNRSSLFNSIDLPTLKPLPLQNYQYTYIKKVQQAVEKHLGLCHWVAVLPARQECTLLQAKGITRAPSASAW
jgi:hypothetical protein